LGVIVVVLAVTTVASLLKVRKDPEATAHAGSIRARSAAGEDERQPR
jgi:tellurite resistance protein TerC